MVSVKRSDIEAAIRRWEKKAKAELFLDDWLHMQSRAWLVAEIEAMLAQSAPESSEVESSRVESNRTRKKGH